VEDEPEFAELAVEFLTRADDQISVTIEPDPETALERFRADPDAVDCIVSDYDMPEMNGLDLLKAVREDSFEIPFIMFTGRGSEEIASEAISLGVSDYIQKEGRSDTYELLAHRIRNSVERRRAEVDAARTRRFLEKVVERATDMIAVVDSKGEIVFVSGSVENILGYAPSEVKEMGPFELVHPDDRERIEEHFRERLTDPDHPTGVTHRARHKAGYDVRVGARAYNLVDDPDVEGVLIYTRATESDDVN
jgi:PAS domain S-box-containing protein